LTVENSVGVRDVEGLGGFWVQGSQNEQGYTTESGLREQDEMKLVPSRIEMLHRLPDFESNYRLNFEHQYYTNGALSNEATSGGSGVLKGKLASRSLIINFVSAGHGVGDVLPTERDSSDLPFMQCRLTSSTSERLV
jgi:hypothetical protein